MDRVINSIRRISLTAVAGCYAVWREAGARWGEVRRDEDQKVRRRVLEARRAANRRAREEAALSRLAASEKHRKKNVRTIQLRKAVAAVQSRANTIRNRGGVISWTNSQILQWHEWSDSRLLKWWLDEVKKERRQKQRDRQSKQKRVRGTGDESRRNGSSKGLGLKRWFGPVSIIIITSIANRRKTKPKLVSPAYL
jgi:hypothetical protein